MAEDSYTASKRANHTWTTEEDKVLVQCLLDVPDSWKGENGFRPGIHNHLEKMMCERMPGCKIKGHPHIGSRVKLWKRQYNAICEMTGPTGGSGFGWNDQMKMIVVEKPIYDEYVKSHPNARGLYNKPFPYFDQLGLIFGKDVATGRDAEVPEDAVNEMESETPLFNDTADDFMDQMGDFDMPPVVDAIPINPTEEVMDHPTGSTSGVKSRKKRVRSEDTVIIAVADAMTDLTQSYREGNTHMSKLVKLKTDSAEKRLGILNELKKMEGLNGLDRAQVVRMLVKDSNLTDVFMEGDDGDKCDIVASLLQNPH